MLRWGTVFTICPSVNDKVFSYICVVMFVYVLYVEIVRAKVEHITLVVLLHIVLLIECL